MAPLLSAPMLTTCPLCRASLRAAIDVSRHLIRRHEKQLCVCGELNFIRSTFTDKVWALAEHLHATGDIEAHLHFHLLGQVGNGTKFVNVLLPPHSSHRTLLPWDHVITIDNPSHNFMTATVYIVNVQTYEYRIEMKDGIHSY